DAGQRVFGDTHRQSGFLFEVVVEPLDQGAATGQHDALVDDVGGEFGRSVLEGDTDTLHDRADRFAQRFGDIGLVDRDFLGHTVDEVAPLDRDLLSDAVFGDSGDAIFLLDPLRRGVADKEVVVAADVGDD